MPAIQKVTISGQGRGAGALFGDRASLQVHTRSIPCARVISVDMESTSCSGWNSSITPRAAAPSCRASRTRSCRARGRGGVSMRMPLAERMRECTWRCAQRLRPCQTTPSIVSKPSSLSDECSFSTPRLALKPVSFSYRNEFRGGERISGKGGRKGAIKACTS